MENLRILVVDRAVPTPNWSGASARLLYIIKAFRHLGYQVDLVVRDSHEMNRIPEILHPLNIFGVYNLRAESKQFERLVEKAALVWFSFFDIAEEYLPVVRLMNNIPIVIDSVDVHSLRLKRQAEITKEDKAFIYADEIQVREAKIYALADTLIGVTEPDCLELKKLAPNVPTCVISNIYETHTPGSDNHKNRQGILFIGNATHPPNSDALELLYQEIFPGILHKMPSIQLSVIGYGTNNRRTENLRNVKVWGQIDNVLPAIKTAVCSVAPLRFGAGIKGKVVESMFYGTPVVATKVALEGMDASHLSNVMIASDWNEFVEYVCLLHQDAALWSRIRHGGLLTTRNIFNESSNRKTIKELLKTLGL